MKLLSYFSEKHHEKAIRLIIYYIKAQKIQLPENEKILLTKIPLFTKNHYDFIHKIMILAFYEGLGNIEIAYDENLTCELSKEEKTLACAVLTEIIRHKGVPICYNVDLWKNFFGDTWPFFDDLELELEVLETIYVSVVTDALKKMSPEQQKRTNQTTEPRSFLAGYDDYGKK